MKISCISFTANGSRINRQLEQWFLQQGQECDCQAFARYAEEAGLSPMKGSFKDWCREHFHNSDVLIFIGAAGIAVRGIAPWVADKKTDPAVLVIDEQGNFVISLLSGHIGGANEMTSRVAGFLGAVPVITTGTDVNHTFAVDVFAARNQLQIEDMQLAKEIAASLIDKKKIAFTSELAVENAVPQVLQCGKVSSAKPEETGQTWLEQGAVSAEIGICVTVHRSGSRQGSPFGRTLRLIPKNVHLGIGCRRNISWEMIEKKVSQVMESCQLDWKSVVGVASIDLKKDEAGLKRFCKNHDLPFTVYTADELSDVEGVFTPSSFVGNVTGVDNVCERSAALDCIRQRLHAGKQNQKGSYRMIQRKTAGDGVTVAIAMEDWSVKFE